jgi:hypothetical protein
VTTTATGGARRTAARANSNTLSPTELGPQDNLIWLDLYNIEPMDIIDEVFPLMRPPDIPNARGIGRADAPLATLTGGTTWPPNEELATLIPSEALRPGLSVQLSPMSYPAHDHSEPSQTSQGGNYNMGLIVGMNITGDRNTPGAMDFPNQPVVGPPGFGTQERPKGPFSPTKPPPWFSA